MAATVKKQGLSQGLLKTIAASRASFLRFVYAF